MYILKDVYLYSLKVNNRTRNDKKSMNQLDNVSIVLHKSLNS